MAVMAGGLTGASRLHLYGLLLILGAIGTIWADAGPALPLAVAGLVMLTCGAWLLGRFLKESSQYQERADR